MSKWKLGIIIMALMDTNIQGAFSQARVDSLTMALQQVFERDSLPGMSVVLVDARHIIYEHNFGYANFEEGTKYSSHSVQSIGSVSKTFAAVALMKAVEMGYFNLDTDINTLLPFRVINPNYPGGVITVRQLSDHSSGIIDNPAILPNIYHFDTALAEYDTMAYRLLQGLGYQQKVEDLPLKTFLYEYLTENGKYYTKDNFGNGAPGTASSYSNIGSALAAYLIEVKSGMTYAEFTTRYILKPLKMDASAWFIDKSRLKEYARPYYNRYAAFPYFHFITYPDGGLRTSTADLSKYLMALIKGYNGDQSLLTKASYDAMFTPQFSKEHPPKGISLATRNKGVFWNLYNNGTIGHDGDDPGVSSFLFFNPKTGLGGVFLCNKYQEDKSRIVNLLVRFAEGR